MDLELVKNITVAAVYKGSRVLLTSICFNDIVAG